MKCPCRAAVVLWTLLVAGCADSGGPVPLGGDSYMLSSTGAWSWSAGAALKADLYRQADAFCRTKGKEYLPERAVTNDGNFTTFAHAEVDFRCLPQGDPALRHPSM